MTSPSITTLKALSERHLSDLDRLGLDETALAVLANAFANWRTGGLQLTPEAFRNKYRSKAPVIERLQDGEFLKRSNANIYEPTFATFAILLVARKRVATLFVLAMEFSIRRAKEHIKFQPNQTFLPFKEFAKNFADKASLADALRLMTSGPYNLNLNGNVDSIDATVSFTDRVHRKGSFLSNVGTFTADLVRNRSRGPFVGGSGIQLSTFSLSSLELVPDAFEQASAAIAKARSDPASAITAANACLEATLKWIAHHEGIAFENGVKLSKLLDLCRDAIALGSNSSNSMARVITSLSHMIPEARNELSSAHGKRPGAIGPTRQEARFIVGTAVHLAECLLDRWDGVRQTREA